eukprot:CAMPEP_0168200892 /NCGR_PEP_ID=MMETSP0139_2-20121125/23343_1 /TAXON_ID=44445 /ORGANISM="Pseudo-nitzschia australis, Strain 10249 10 AB" /LENGTH=403 /DNA_ID=CAMNT_0008126267 /DNA_START=130 /DNA_END=1341 /DNA_ORIENTATION=+
MKIVMTCTFRVVVACLMAQSHSAHGSASLRSQDNNNERELNGYADPYQQPYHEDYYYPQPYPPPPYPDPNPTERPTPRPTPNPTNRPTPQPTPAPTGRPSPRPTPNPTPLPTFHPTFYPTHHPTLPPTQFPTPHPTNSQPSANPTQSPSVPPTANPSPHPSPQPSAIPSISPHPTRTQPSEEPSDNPTQSEEPSEIPTQSDEPSENPTQSDEPSENPTQSDKPSVGTAATIANIICDPANQNILSMACRMIRDTNLFDPLDGNSGGIKIIEIQDNVDDRALQLLEIPDDDLDKNIPYTFFAPTNAAYDSIEFFELPFEEQEDTAKYHIISGRELRYGDLGCGREYTMLNNRTSRTECRGARPIRKFQIGDGNSDNDAFIIERNKDARNGIIHLVDGILLKTHD